MSLTCHKNLWQSFILTPWRNPPPPWKEVLNKGYKTVALYRKSWSCSMDLKQFTHCLKLDSLVQSNSECILICFLFFISTNFCRSCVYFILLYFISFCFVLLQYLYNILSIYMYVYLVICASNFFTSKKPGFSEYFYS